MSKKAQVTSAKDVAVLLLLIAVFIVLYILLLPPAEREALLNESIYVNETTKQVLQPETLLSESPGLVSPIAEQTITHEFNPISLFIKSEPITKTLASSLYISRGLFSENSQTLTFPVEDVSNIKDATLFFSTKEPSGKLEIKLNNNIIFFDKIKPDEIKLISMPINYLQRNNVITLKASFPGLLFWKTNSFTLGNLGVKETFELINPREERVFSVSQIEKSNMERAFLSYSLYCNSLEGDNTKLKIYVNKNQLFSSLVSCGTVASSMEIPSNYFITGSNKLIFVIEEGDFTINNIKIKTELREKAFPTYHFNLDSDNYNNIISEKRSVLLSFNFANTQQKTASIIVNNQQFELSTAESSYSKDISKSVNSGDNVIKIVPSNAFTINTLKVTQK